MEETSSYKSDRILEEIHKRRQKPEAGEVEASKVKLVIFTLGTHHYALFGEEVKEILTMLRIYPVPGTPAFILGIVNVRGDIQSVIDINLFLGQPGTEPTPRSRIIIAEKAGVRSGILVDSVEDVLDVSQTAIQKTLSTLNDSVRSFVAGELTYKHHNVTVLDAGQLFEKMTES